MPALKKLAAMFALCLLLTAFPVLAQEATPEPAAAAEVTEAPTGVSTLILLMGVGAVLLVGGIMVARDRFGSSPGA